jgi:NCS1 family nucleobase:cation symporter-1
MSANPIGTVVDDGIHELREDISDSEYYNPDLAPTRFSQRFWGLKDMTVLWISLSACIPTYLLASGLVDKSPKGHGMNWWQAVLTIFLGNVIVLIPMVLNAHAGTKYGVPFPVYCRASFGIRGANIPALLRALVACGWFGIQAWIGGYAIYSMLAIHFDSWDRLEKIFFGINAPQLMCFLLFWTINMFVVYRGINSIRLLLNIKAPLLIILGLALLAWAYVSAGGFGNMLSQPSDFVPGGTREGQFWTYFFPALTANVGFWATLALNIPDFSRYARSQRDQVLGQAFGLPTTMGLYSFIGVAVTSAAFVIYRDLPAEQQKDLWDPIFLLRQFKDPVLLTVAMLSLALATLATNIAANVVSPANDFAHLWPRAITFRIGGLITGIIGIAILPWKLVENAEIFINTWLVGYSSLLGAVGGILIADYFLVRRTRLDLPGLYRREGPYWYQGGVNPVALIALALSIAICIPGFLERVNSIHVPAIWKTLYDYAWFTSFGLAFGIYLAFARLPHRIVV